MTSRIRLTGARVVDPANELDATMDLYIDGGFIVDRPTNPETFETQPCDGCVIAPAFIDLYGNLPDFGAATSVAARGGFGTVALADPTEAPAVAHDKVARAADSPVRIIVSGAVSCGTEGNELTEMGSLLGAGCDILSQGRQAVSNTRFLKNAFEYAARFKKPLFLRAGDADLEAGGIVREGPRSVWLGLPGIPTVSEEIGIHRVAALSRVTGAAVHLTHIWSKLGVETVRHAKAQGTPITASTTPFHVGVDDHHIETTGYHGYARFTPPLGDYDDRQALLQGLEDGTIDAIGTDHRPMPPHLQDREIQQAVPGSISYPTALPLLLESLDVALTVRVLTTGPARVLMETLPSLSSGTEARLVIFDPEERWTVTDETLGCTYTNTPLRGQELQGRVRRILLGGNWL